MQPTGYKQGYSRQVKGLLLLALLTVGLGGCFSNKESQSSVEDSIAQPLNTSSKLVNNQTNVEITVPADWIKAGDDQRGNADIYATYPLKDLYTLVLSESDVTLNQFSIENNSEQYRWLIEKEMDTYEGATKTTLTQLDGMPALQYEIRGQVDNTKVVYLHTTVKGENSYYQVVGWTRADRYAENKEALQTVIQSFDKI